MDPGEIEFLAEKESIEIVPNFTHGVMHLIQGDVGPFRPGLPVSVPLWLAVNLRQRQRCRLVRPEWLAVDRLEEVSRGSLEVKKLLMCSNSVWKALRASLIIVEIWRN